MNGLTETFIPPHEIRPAALVTARSYLCDRFTPDCEIIYLPARVASGGTMRFGRRRIIARAPQPKSLSKRIRSGFSRSARRINDGVIIDFRLRSPDNWAHFLDNHLPIFFRICDVLGIPWDEMLIILPKDIPGHILNVAAMFGLEVLATDETVEGDGVAFEVAPWTAIRPVRVNWVGTPKVRKAVAKATASGPPLPERVFLARRGTRAIANENEIADFLAGYGFKKIYPETLSPADQFRLFHEARMIIAIHGAGLAPLLYLPPSAPLALLLEILPCGHMTDFYRVIADKLDIPWIGVQGRIKSTYVEPSYQFNEPFKRFSLDNFEVDVASLERAFDIAGVAELLDTSGGSRNLSHHSSRSFYPLRSRVSAI